MDIMKNQKKTAISRLGQCRRILLNDSGSRFSRWRLDRYVTSAASAQLTTADILGTVTDRTGASIPNAT